MCQTSLEVMIPASCIAVHPLPSVELLTVVGSPLLGGAERNPEGRGQDPTAGGGADDQDAAAEPRQATSAAQLPQALGAHHAGACAQLLPFHLP
jgi:hypothetical protein